MDIHKSLTRSVAQLSFVVFIALITFSAESCKSRKSRTAHKGKKIEAKANRFDETDIASNIEGIFADRKLDDTIWEKKKVFNISQVLQKTYQDEDYFPVWLTENGDTSYVTTLIQELSDLKNDGLNPERYQVTALKAMLHQYATAASVTTDQVIRLDTLCTQSYLLASRDLLQGRIVPKKADSLWFHANDSLWKPYIGLANMGKGEGDYPSLDSFRSKLPTYTILRNALVKYDKLFSDSTYLSAKAAAAEGHLTDSIKDIIIDAELPWTVDGNDSFDSRHGALVAAYRYYMAYKSSKADSIVQSSYRTAIDTITCKIALNMERLRWMQQHVEQTYILVNIPLLELFFRIDNQDAMHMEVVVGKTIRQTPSLNAKMANVVINPPWGVPPTIMKKDVLPGMVKGGQAYLNKKGLKVYDFKGKSVNANTVNANNYKRFVFRQDPGDDNALGYVKFNLPNKWDIYLHDTPHREDFGKKDRFKSSGCIRVQQPKELAEFILSGIEGKKFDQEILDSMIQTKKTRYEVLAKKIPVHIVYLTAFEDSTNTRVHFISDVYRKDAKLKELLLK